MGQNDGQNELYQDVSIYLRAWYKAKKNDSPIELGSDLGLAMCPFVRIFVVKRRLSEAALAAHVNVSPITNKILYQATGKVRENWF